MVRDGQCVGVWPPAGSRNDELRPIRLKDRWRLTIRPPRHRLRGRNQSNTTSAEPFDETGDGGIGLPSGPVGRLSQDRSYVAASGMKKAAVGTREDRDGPHEPVEPAGVFGVP